MPRIRTGTAAETVFYLKSRLSYPGESSLPEQPVRAAGKRNMTMCLYTFIFIFCYSFN